MLTDRRDQQFTPPPPQLKPFAGAGRTLGGSQQRPAAVAGDDGTLHVAGGADVFRKFVSREFWVELYELLATLFSLLWTLTTFSGGAAAGREEDYELILDEAQPTTTLKLQLADGARHEVGGRTWRRPGDLGAILIR